MIVERSVFNALENVEAVTVRDDQSEDGDNDGPDSDEEAEAKTAVVTSKSGKVVTGTKGKKVEYWCLEYIRDQECRRKVIDRAYGNPQRDSESSGQSPC